MQPAVPALLSRAAFVEQLQTVREQGALSSGYSAHMTRYDTSMQLPLVFGNHWLASLKTTLRKRDGLLGPIPQPDRPPCRPHERVPCCLSPLSLTTAAAHHCYRSPLLSLTTAVGVMTLAFDQIR